MVYEIHCLDCGARGDTNDLSNTNCGSCGSQHTTVRSESDPTRCFDEERLVRREE